MIKAKHYVYARLVTAIVSTSTMAGSAVKTDMLESNTPKRFYNRLVNTSRYPEESGDSIHHDWNKHLFCKTGNLKNNDSPVITSVKTVVKNNTVNNSYTSMFKNFFFGAGKPEVEVIQAKVPSNSVKDSVGIDQKSDTIEDSIDDFIKISAMPDLSPAETAADNVVISLDKAIKKGILDDLTIVDDYNPLDQAINFVEPATNNKNSVSEPLLEPAAEQQSDMPATPINIQMNHIGPHYKAADKSSYDTMDLDDVMAAQNMKLEDMVVEYKNTDNSKIVTLDFDNAGNSNKQAVIAGYTLNDVKQFAALAKLSYSESKNRNDLLLRYQMKGYNISHFGTTAENSGFVMIKGREVIVSYHGTESIRNLATDFWATMNTSSFTSGRFHSGFYEGFKKTWDEIYAVIHAHAHQNNLKLTDMKIDFTGHSLGGALAGLGATRWAEKVNKDNVSLISFAAPKFCDTEAARRVTELFGDRILRITQHAFDIVPSVGPGVFGFIQVGSNLHITAEYWGDMHSMNAYEEKVVSLPEDKYVASDHTYQIFNGGYYNPLNIVDSAIKYGLHEGVLSPVHKRFSAVRKWIFGSSVMIEDVLAQNDTAAHKKSREILKLNHERNMKLLEDDKSSLEAERLLFQNANTDLNPGLLKIIKENELRYQIIIEAIKQKKDEFKKTI